MSMIKCPFCGKELPAESAFCPYCMERITTPVEVSVPSSGEKSRRGISVMILITAVIVLAVIVLTALRFCDRTGDKGAAETIGESSPTVNENDDINVPVGNVGQEEVQVESTTAATDSQTTDNVTDTPAEGGSENVPDTTPSATVPVNGTTQSVTGNGGNNPTTTESQVTACSHNWVAMTETVYHEEEGHYEDVDRSRPITMYRCPMCYKEHTSLNLYYTHFDTIHVPSYPGDPIGMFREQYTTDIEYEPYTERIWVVDREAYSETVTTGHKCSKCGKIR